MLRKQSNRQSFFEQPSWRAYRICFEKIHCTWLLNKLLRYKNHNPYKAHETPPQNCSAAGFTYVPEQPGSLIPSSFGTYDKEL